MLLRKAIFLLGCIGLRSFLSYLSSNINYLPYIGGFYLLFSIGILHAYIFGNEIADRQLEWLGDKKIWWNQMRLVHGLIWLIFVIALYFQLCKSYLLNKYILIFS